MAIEDFNPDDMQILMRAIERVSASLNLSDSEEHLAMKSRVAALVVECAEGGERDVQKLIDCAHEGLGKGNGR
jgi:hypothetical protein